MTLKATKMRPYRTNLFIERCEDGYWGHSRVIDKDGEPNLLIEFGHTMKSLRRRQQKVIMEEIGRRPVTFREIWMPPLFNYKENTIEDEHMGVPR